MKTCKASELVIDFDLYPRSNVDALNVRAMTDALNAGIELPPIVIERKSKRIVDGVHRHRAHQAFGGEDAPIECVEKSYKNDADLFIDAMRYNAGHGARLDPHDRARCTIIAERLSIPMDAVAGALHMPADRLGALRDDRMAKTSAGAPLALKRTIRGWAGKRLNARQVAANEKLSGMNQVFYANQLIELIEADLLDTGDDKLIERLRVLHELLDGVLAAK